jgi:hypothetical protein
MKRLLTILSGALALCAIMAAPATAAFDLRDLDVYFEAEDGTPTLLAGSHPFAMTTTVGVTTKSTPEGDVPEGELKDLTAVQIPGFVGNQTAVPTCSEPNFAKRFNGRPDCPDEAAVGYAAVEAEYEVIPPEARDQLFHVPVYNLEAPQGIAARLGFVVLSVPVTIDIKVSQQPPYNLIAELSGVPQTVLFYQSKLTLWGNPASDAHDDLRGNCLGDVLIPTPGPVSEGNCPVDTPEEAFLTLPRACGGPLSTLFSATSWLGATASGVAQTRDASEPQGIEGCEGLGFSADVSTQTSSSSASAPTGLDFALSVDDKGLTDPTERAQSDIRKVVATLPEGMNLNPSAANGLGACSLSQYQAESLGAGAAAGCPGNSKIGTVEVETPLLEEPLEGQLYVAAQNDNPFNSLFAIYLVIKSERYGILIKQAGRVDPDPQTGRLTSTFEEIPQLPFSRLAVHFRGGDRAPLTTPATCGTKTATAILTPWSGGAAITASSSFQISSGPGGAPCPSGLPGFAPGLAGGSANDQAGAYSPFSMRLTRNDGEQEITRFDAVLPPGVVGKIAGLGRCSEAQIAAAAAKSGRSELAAPSCPASSRIGAIQAGAGVGPFPTYVDGSLYLAGPHAGAPLSVVAITPAVAGPFDLGTVVIRETLDLNPTTAEVEVGGAGPEGVIPRILKGVPLQLRDLRIAIDRPNFTLNATSCEPKTLKATLFGSPGTAALSSHYQAADCGALGFKPKLNLKLLGATKRGQFPAVRSTLIPRAGDANAAKAVVTLPRSQQIENAHLNNPCTRVQFNANACPAKSILGKAKAFSPLLDAPLEGNVYFRSNGGERELPDIVADLKGQFRIILVGFIDTKKGRIRTTFANIPDAPVSRFQLNLAGGKRGLLVNNRNICLGKQRAKLALTGQNAKRHVTQPVLKTSCKGKQGGKRGKGGGRK